MTNREIVSTIINDLRALSVDDRISERYVLSTLRSTNALFLKRENDQLRLHNYDIWTPIECLNMIPSEYAECAGVKKVFSYMRSEKQLPEMYSYSNGPLIKNVLSLDDWTPYLPSTLKDFKSIQNREFPSKHKYFWLRDRYLIIPNGPEKVILEGCFLDPSAAKALSSNAPVCINPMDEIFSTPPHLVDVIKDKVLDHMMKIYKRIVKDEVADLDTNDKEPKQNRIAS